jgi:hypothetical protein
MWHPSDGGIGGQPDRTTKMVRNLHSPALTRGTDRSDGSYGLISWRESNVFILAHNHAIIYVLHHV